MKSIVMTTSEMWKTIFDILEMDTSHVSADMLTENQNEALNRLFDMIISTYCNNIAELEYQLNQTLAKKYVEEIVSNNKVQFNIVPKDNAIDLLFAINADTECRWTKLFDIADHTLSCRNFKLRYHVKVEALAKLFNVDSKTTRYLLSVFGTVYHGEDIISPHSSILAEHNTIYHDVKELCYILKQNLIDIANESSWLQDYLKGFKTMVKLNA